MNNNKLPSNRVIRILEIPEVKLDGKYKIIDEKTIKYIEKRVRNSYEYREFIKYIKYTLDVNSCIFYEGFKIQNGFSVEIHHSPFTLYEYVYTVCNKHLDLNKGYFYDLEVAEEVTKLHYEFLVGLVPLNPTAHELVHSGQLNIHPDLIIGSYTQFIHEYQEWMPDEMKDKLNDIEELKKDPSDKIPTILQKNKVLLVTPYNPLLSNNIVSKCIENKLSEIDKLGE